MSEESLEEEVVVETEAEDTPSPDDLSEPEEASTDAEQEPLDGDDEEPEVEGEPVDTEPAPSEASSEQAARPFSYKTYGKVVDVEGATLHEVQGPDGEPVDMLVMPKSAFDRHIHPNVVDKSEIRRRESQYQRQIADLQPERNETVIRAKTLIDAVSKALESQEAFEEFAVNFDRNKDQLALQVDNAIKDAKIRQRDDVDHEANQEQEYTQLQETLSTDLPASVDYITESLGVQAPPHILQQIKEYVGSNPGAFYQYATEDQAREYGVQVGSLVRRDDLLAKTIQSFLGVANASSAQVKQTTEAAAKNKKALHPKKAPPVVTAKGSAAPEKKQKEMSKEEWREAMGLN